MLIADLVGGVTGSPTGLSSLQMMPKTGNNGVGSAGVTKAEAVIFSTEGLSIDSTLIASGSNGQRLDNGQSDSVFSSFEAVDGGRPNLPNIGAVQDDLALPLKFRGGETESGDDNQDFDSLKPADDGSASIVDSSTSEVYVADPQDNVAGNPDESSRLLLSWVD